MQQAGEARAVFVDPTGRRGRLVSRTCWAVGALLSLYVALVVVSLLLPPSLSRLAIPGLGPVLPGPAAAPLIGGGGAPQRPDVLLASPSARPSAMPARTAAPFPVARPTVTTAPGAPSDPAPTSAPSPSAAPAPATRAPGRPSTAPSPQSGSQPSRPAAAPSEPPGQAERSPRPRPSQTRGPR